MFDYKNEVLKLIEWARAYYEDNKLLATDDEYDKLYHQVLEYEKKNPNEVHPNTPTKRVGSVSTYFRKSKHPNKMWSQQDIFDYEELDEWLSKKGWGLGSSVLIESKMDGLSLKVIYEDGLLKSAVTRGDGIIGDDVTVNAKVIDGIPNEISYKEYLEVNGEVVINKKNFIKINKYRVEQKLTPFANARNAAAGSIRLHDVEEVKRRKLEFFPWEVVDQYSVVKSDSSRNILDPRAFEHNLVTNNIDDILEACKFKRKPFSMLVDEFHGGDLGGYIYDIHESVKKCARLRDKMDIDIDGAVIKITDETIRNELGYTNKFPKWSCAYKFPPVEKTTKILSIVEQVGRTGVITPVAILTPTEIDGTVVERVTLHNYSEIKNKDIRVGDEIILIKSGDIIPKISKVFKDRRTGKEEIIVEPTKCPECNHAVVKDEVYIKCVNPNCQSITVRNISFFAGRDYMNIAGLGISAAEELVKNNLVRTPLDLYSLSYDKLELLEGFKDKKINNLLTAINNSKGVDLNKFVASLGIKGFGRTVSSSVCDEYSYNIFNTTFEELTSIDGVGDEIASNFIDYMKNNREYVMELFSTVKPKDAGSIRGKYTKMHFVLTGSMVGGKAAVADKIERQGGIIKSTVSKTTDYLVYGESPGSKLDKAKELGITTIYYNDL